MKKNIILLVILLVVGVSYSQKMMTRTGEIKFDATVPGAMDEVIGNNKTVSSIYDKETAKLVVQGMVKSFKFKRSILRSNGSVITMYDGNVMI